MKFIKRTYRDNLFTAMFSEVEYILLLYQALHPEDKTTTEAEIDNVTISNVVTNNFYNDLGFTVNGKMIILVEAQSSWSVNIAIRSVIYLMSSYKNYVAENKINLYGSKKADLPKPELYVIYTGKRGDKPDTISLAKDIFNCEDSCIDATIKVIYDSKKGDIINQYRAFITILTEQINIYGLTKKALAETIKICKNENILKKYLTKHEQEVITMFDFLFDQDYVKSVYEEELKEEGRKEARKKDTEEAIEKLVHTCKAFDIPEQKIAQRLVIEYNLSENEATEKVEKYSK